MLCQLSDQMLGPSFLITECDGYRQISTKMKRVREVYFVA